MSYRFLLRRSRAPHSPQVQTSVVPTMWPPNLRSNCSVLRIAGSPQPGHGSPGFAVGCFSSAASRFSRSSIRPGASFTRFHSGHLSSSARISERMANAVS